MPIGETKTILTMLVQIYNASVRIVENHAHAAICTLGEWFVHSQQCKSSKEAVCFAMV